METLIAIFCGSYLLYQGRHHIIRFFKSSLFIGSLTFLFLLAAVFCLLAAATLLIVVLTDLSMNRAEGIPYLYQQISPAWPLVLATIGVSLLKIFNRDYSCDSYSK